MEENEMNLQNGQKPVEAVGLWLIKLFTGALVIIVLTVHFLVNHALAPNGLLSYTEVVKYYQNPIIPIMEAIFLIVVVSHSLLGLRGILLDLNPSRSVLRILDAVLLIVGVVAIIYGIWLLGAVVAQGLKV
jgi:succinate dehydrogenase / fumarate reductase membrane anchor subunit